MKKLLVFMLAIFMVLSMAGCGPKEPEEPEFQPLTEEAVIEFVKGLPQRVIDFERDSEYFYNMNDILILLGLNPADVLIDPNAELDETSHGIGSVDVEVLQAKSDEVFGAGKYDIATMYADLIVDGKIIGPVFIYEPNAFFNIEYGEEIFEVYESSDNYMVIKRHCPFTTNFLSTGESYEDYNDSYYVVIPTVDGPRLYSFTYFPKNAQKLLVIYLPKDNSETADPNIVEITEDGLMQYAQSIPLELYDPFGHRALLNQDANYLKDFCDIDEFDIIVDDMGGILVTRYQEKVDNLFGKGRYNIEELFADFIVDGYIMGAKSNVSQIQKENIRDMSYEIAKIKDNYAIVNRYYLVTYVDGDYSWDSEIKETFSIYPTADGYKVWAVTSAVGYEVQTESWIDYPR